MRRFHRRHAGFTLVELLIVVAIIAVLLGLLLPAVHKIRDSAKRTQCQNNLKQIVLAVHSMNDTHNYLPPGIGSYPPGNPTTSALQQSLHYSVLPFIEHDDLYQAGYASGIFSAGNKNASAAPNGLWRLGVSVYVCPADPTNSPSGIVAATGKTSYGFNALTFGAFKYNTAAGSPPPVTITSLNGKNQLPLSIPDGLSNTVLFTDKYAACAYYDASNTKHGGGTWWGTYGGQDTWISTSNTNTPAIAMVTTGLSAMFQVLPDQDLACDYTRAASPHEGGINVALGDGSVRFVAENISPQTWWLTLLPNDGLSLPSDW
jgi:prepilin-type N-terminal cleavage/methylation domain-containing protein/prepilin-type processing-associated H-X9-DG protein